MRYIKIMILSAIIAQNIAANTNPIQAEFEQAVKNDDTTKAALLLRNNKGLINVQETTDGNTPLILAIKNESLEMAKLLLQFKADPSIKSLFFISALEQALQSDNYQEFINLFLPHFKQNSQDWLATLARFKDLTESIQRTKYFVNLNLQNQNDYTTAFEYAHDNNNMALIKFLLDHNFNPNNNKHHSPILFKAISANKKELTITLLSHGARLNTNHFNFIKTNPTFSAEIKNIVKQFHKIDINKISGLAGLTFKQAYAWYAENHFESLRKLLNIETPNQTPMTLICKFKNYFNSDFDFKTVITNLSKNNEPYQNNANELLQKIDISCPN